ncbi:hypothetical protein D3C84_661480 [compost metagenome]
MQATALYRQSIDTVVAREDTLKALRQQPGITRCDDRGGGEHITDLYFRIKGTHFGGATHLGVFVLRLPLIIDGHNVATVATVAGIELHADHRKCIDTHPEGALGITGFELCDNRVRPGFGISITG